jgi:regulator of protease activity HflC (stomatin/prohibitin superfamily)
MVGAVDADALVGKRVDFARELLATLRPEAETFGVAVERVDVRDIMFPGELKRAFQEVIRAQKEGQAALERARAESATTRSLANTARAIEANPALMQLRLLQSMNEISSRGGNTFAFGIPEGAFGRANGKEK